MNELALFAGAGGFPVWNDMLKLHIITSLGSGKWTKNTNTVQSAIALFAASHLPPEIKIRSSSAAPTFAVEYCKHARRPKCAWFAVLSFCRQGLKMKLVPGYAEQSCGCQGERLTRWLKSGGGSPCSVAASSPDASETKQTGRQLCLVIPLSPFVRTLSPILNQECHGRTMARGLTHGA